MKATAAVAVEARQQAEANNNNKNINLTFIALDAKDAMVYAALHLCCNHCGARFCTISASVNATSMWQI